MSTLYSVLFFIKAVSVLLFKEEMKIKYFCANYNCSSQLPWAALYFSLSRVLAVLTHFVICWPLHASLLQNLYGTYEFMNFKCTDFVYELFYQSDF